MINGLPGLLLQPSFTGSLKNWKFAYPELDKAAKAELQKAKQILMAEKD
jgi:hypothetical protein